MNKLKSLIQGFYVGKNLKKQLPIMLFGVFMMGFSMSFLVLVDWGTDTYTNMNLALSSKLGMSLGNWQLILNVILLILVLLLGADNFGFGTLANMIFVGYLIDFFDWVWGKTIPASFWESTVNKAIVMVLALAVFVVAAAVYMDAGLGVSPCDAISFILQKWMPKVPFKVIRIGYDFTLILIAYLCNHRLYIVTILMALSLGPVIQFVGERIRKWFSF